MSTCDDVRTMIATGDTEDAFVQHHLPGCAECTRYAESDAAFERFMAGNVILTPPAQLTNKLLAIATDHAVPPHARTWWASLAVVFIGVVAVLFSLYISAQMTLWFTSASSYHTYATTIVTAPDTIYAWAVNLPTIGVAVATFGSVRIQLILMLVIGLFVLGYYNQRQPKRTK